MARQQDDSLRDHHFSQRVVAVSNPANRGQVYPAMVWRYGRRLDDLDDVFPSGFGLGLSLRASDEA